MHYCYATLHAIQETLTWEVISLKQTNAISGSMTDKVAPSEADMAQRLQSSEQAQQKTAATATDSYVSALARGMETPADENQAQKQAKS